MFNYCKENRKLLLVLSYIFLSFSTQAQSRRYEMNYLNDTVPSFKIIASNGKIFNSEVLRGKVILLDFWEQYCGPCIKELPNLQLNANEYNSDSVIVLSLCRDSTDLFNRILKEKHITTLNVAANTRPFQELMGIQIYPAFAVIDKNGILRNYIFGSVDRTYLENMIRKVLRTY